jgi:hypothetical protein
MTGFQNNSVVLGSQAFTTSAGDNNDLPIEGSMLLVTTSNNNDAITGISAPAIAEGEVALLFVVNAHPSNTLMLKHDSASSLAGNRILLASGVDLSVPPKKWATMGYIPAIAAWQAGSPVG